MGWTYGVLGIKIKLELAEPPQIRHDLIRGITDSDLTRNAVATGLDPNATTVASCMSRSIVTTEEDESLKGAMWVMKN